MRHRLRIPGLTVVLALVLAAALLAVAPAARAVQPDEVLADPVLEQRARALGRELRCLVCQNQSLDDSNADLARDLRLLVRERLQAGDSDAEVLAFVQARYGDFVLLRPPVRPETWALWFAPVAVALLGAGTVVLYLRRRRPGPGCADESAPLSESESRRLARVLAEDGDR